MTTTDEQSQQQQLLAMNHQIREIEHSLNTAKRRRRLSNLYIGLGPVAAVLLYVMWWLPWIERRTFWVIAVPAIPIVVGFSIAATYMKINPGGRPSTRGGTRPLESDLELNLARERETRKYMVANAIVSSKVRRTAYKEDAYSDIDQLRTESRGYRRVNNVLQGILIIGSLAATGTSGVAAQLANVRWGILGVTFIVGISSGFMGYFKYKERSFYLQQTADAIEHEWEAVEVGVGRYKHIDGEEARLEAFVEEVHRLKSEQKKRQQNLEQPPESRNPDE